MWDRKPLLFGIIAVLALLLGLGAKFFLSRQPTALAALRVDSFPKTTVFLDDKQVGETPYYSDQLKTGEHKVKLLPTGGTSGTFVTYETKITLSPGTLTYLSRNLGPSDSASSGQLLTLDNLPAGTAELAVVSDPDGANVTVDGVDKGKTSLILRDIAVGDHEITVSLTGYSDQIVRGRAIAGYRLNAVVKLAKLSPDQSALLASPSGQIKPTASLIATSSASIAKPYVVIKDTPTGFLRVRTDPGVSATESGKVYPGDKFSLLDEAPDWDKINLATFSGWVADQYVDKFK